MPHYIREEIDRRITYANAAYDQVCGMLGREPFAVKREEYVMHILNQMEPLTWTSGSVELS